MHAAAIRLVSAVALALFAVSLAGCTADPSPTPLPTVAVTSTPVFASDDDALAAAEKAYAAYTTTFDEVATFGGHNTDPLSEVAEGAALTKALASAAEFADSSTHQSGQTTFSVSHVQSYQDAGPKLFALSLYVCDDLESTDVLDVNGDSVVSPDRISRIPFIVSFVATGGAASDLILSDKALWNGRNYCV